MYQQLVHQAVVPAQAAKATRAKATPLPTIAVLPVPAPNTCVRRVHPLLVHLQRVQVAVPAIIADPARRAETVHPAEASTEAAARRQEAPLPAQAAVQVAATVAVAVAQAQAAVIVQEAATAVQVVVAAQAEAEEDNFQAISIV